MKEYPLDLAYDQAGNTDYRFTPLELLVYYLYKIFNPDYIPKYYKKCIIRSLARQLKANKCDFYHFSKNSLTPRFAQTIFQLFKSAYSFHKFLQGGYFSVNLTQCSDAKEVPVIEQIFHAFYTEDSLESYPFYFPNISQKVATQKIVQIPTLVERQINGYLVDISDETKKSFDEHYSHVRFLSKLYDDQNLAFIQRFNPYMNYHKELSNNHTWYFVTIDSVISYLERLSQFIENCEVSIKDLPVIKALNKSFNIQNPQYHMEEDQLVQVWNDFCEAVNTLKEHQNLLILLKIARQSQQITVSKKEYHTSSSQIFENSLRFRSSQLIAKIAQEALEQQIFKATDEISSIDTTQYEQQLGLYTKEYHHKLYPIVPDPFPYYSIFPLMVYFVSTYADSWLKNFMISLDEKSKFVHESDKKKLNTYLTNLDQFIDLYNKFLVRIQLDQPFVKQILTLSEKDFLNPSEKQKLDAYVISIHSQAHKLLIQFKMILLLGEYLSLSITRDLAHNQQKFIINHTKMSHLFTKDNCQKLLQLAEFSGQIKSCIDIIKLRDFTQEEEDAVV